MKPKLWASSILLCVVVAGCSHTGSPRPATVGSPADLSAMLVPPSPDPSHAGRHHVQAFKPVYGKFISCGRLPFPGSISYVDRLRHCWIAEPTRRQYEFYMGGREEHDKGQGVLVAARDGLHRKGYLETPARTGRVNIYFATWAYVCFTTPGADVGDFLMRAHLFEAEEDAEARCPAPPS